VLVDELAMTVAELHANLLSDLKGTLKMQLRDMQQGLRQALEHEMSERKQFESRTIHSFETLKESLQSPLDETQEDLSNRARERAQEAWEQFANDPMATNAPADMVMQAAQASQTSASATCMDDTAAVVPSRGGNHSQHSAQSPIQETDYQPTQELVSMEDTHACTGGDGAAGPRHPMGMKAQTVHSTQLKCTSEPPVPRQDDTTVCNFAESAPDPPDLSGVLMQTREALNSEAQVVPESSVDNGNLPRESWRTRYEEIHQRMESGSLNQAEAVDLALRALSAEEAPGPSRRLDSDVSMRNTFFSNCTGRLPVLPNTDNSTLAHSVASSLHRFKCQTATSCVAAMNDGPEVTATSDASH